MDFLLLSFHSKALSHLGSFKPHAIHLLLFALIFAAVPNISQARTFQYQLNSSFIDMDVSDPMGAVCVEGTLYSSTGCVSPPDDAYLFDYSDLLALQDLGAIDLLETSFLGLDAIDWLNPQRGSFKFDIPNGANLPPSIYFGGPHDIYDCRGSLTWVCGVGNLDTATGALDMYNVGSIWYSDPAKGEMTFFDDTFTIFTYEGVQYSNVRPRLNFVISDVSLAPVPLPSASLSFFGALVAMTAFARRRRRRQLDA